MEYYGVVTMVIVLVSDAPLLESIQREDNDKSDEDGAGSDQE